MSTQNVLNVQINTIFSMVSAKKEKEDAFTMIKAFAHVQEITSLEAKENVLFLDVVLMMLMIDAILAYLFSS